MNEQGIGYLQQLGLKREPFSSTPDSDQDDFFLLDKDRAQRLNILYHMVQNSELLLLVTGCLGSGKTSLLHRFLDMRNDSWRHCCIDANTMMNPDQLLVEIAEGFGLPQDSVNFGNAFESIRKRLNEMKLSELMPILVIDDAHELPVASLTVLMKLSELADNNERLLRIVLFAEDSINELFNAPELKEVRHRVTHTLTMPLLSEQQTTEYLQYRLSVAGYNGDPVFSKGQVRKIHRMANGIPGQVNMHAQELLLDISGDQNSGGYRDNTRLRSAVSVVAILAIAIGITWYLSRDVLDQIGKQSSTPTDTELESRELPLIPPTKQVKPVEVVEPAPVAVTPVEPIVPVPAPVEVSSEPVTADISTTGTNPFVLPTLPAETTEAETPIETAPTAPVPAETVTPASETAEPITPDSSQPAPKPEIKTAAKPVPALVTKPAAKPAPVATNKNWLAKQNPAHFTLQLMGSRKRSAVELVQRAHKLGSNSAIVHTQLKGADWYILVYGSYSTKEQARERIKTLPAALRLTEPWPRLIKDIQALK